jgi:hypothetical protein
MPGLETGLSLKGVRCGEEELDCSVCSSRPPAQERSVVTMPDGRIDEQDAPVRTAVSEQATVGCPSRTTVSVACTLSWPAAAGTPDQRHERSK